MKRSGRLLSWFISSGDSSRPSICQLLSMREGVTLLGMTEVPRCRPQTSRTWAVVLPCLSAMAASVLSWASGELVLPRHE